jgi:hypothetical protein
MIEDPRTRAERSYSHRGFSPVMRSANWKRNRFNGFVPLDNEKPLETVQEPIGFLDHRAKATV